MPKTAHIALALAVVGALVGATCSSRAHAGRSKARERLLRTERDRSARTARAHFERAEASYRRGAFRDAIRSYSRAYDEMPHAAFLYNMAQCHMELKEYDKAISIYWAYLEVVPKDADRSIALKGIRAAKRALRNRRNERSFRPKRATVSSPENKTRSARAPRVKHRRAAARPAAVTPAQKSLSGSPTPTPAPASIQDPSPSPSPTTGPTAESLLHEIDGHSREASRIPFYGSWWFWSAIGALVVGSAAAASVVMGHATSDRTTIAHGELAPVDIR